MISHHGSMAIGEVVRSSMKTVVEDSVLVKFNRKGREGKKELPAVIYVCLLRKYIRYEVNIS